MADKEYYKNGVVAIKFKPENEQHAILLEWLRVWRKRGHPKISDLLIQAIKAAIQQELNAAQPPPLPSPGKSDVPKPTASVAFTLPKMPNI